MPNGCIIRVFSYNIGILQLIFINILKTNYFKKKNFIYNFKYNYTKRVNILH